MPSSLNLPKSLRRVLSTGDSVADAQTLESQIERCLAVGDALGAFNNAVEAINRFPENPAIQVLTIRALVSADALDDALTVLEQVVPNPLSLDETLGALWNSLKESLVQSDEKAGIASLRAVLAELGNGQAFDDYSNWEALGMLARVHKALWARQGRVTSAQRAYRLYRYSFEQSQGIWPGINAASLAMMLGDRDVARQLATAVLERCRVETDDPFWLAATVGEATLLLGRYEDSKTAYEEAARMARGRNGYVASALSQLRLLADHGVQVPADVWKAIRSPQVVAFVGHRLDEPGQAFERFPATRHAEIASSLAELLHRIDAKIGYSSAACGSDLLFVEAMLERDAEVHIVLPFSLSDFEDRFVTYGGANWLRRFRRALKLAHTVHFITEEPMLGDLSLLDFQSHVLTGYARLHAQRLEGEAHLVAVWDGQVSLAGDPVGRIVQDWPDSASKTVLPLTILGDKPEMDLNSADERRVISSFMFCDVYGYSKLEESQQPAFIREFLNQIATSVGRPEFVNTAGDGLFVAMPSAIDLAEYALSLQRFVAETNWGELGLPANLTMRVALHSGPAFRFVDPMTGKHNLYGSHVNRAARMEPVTVPGEIYASEQFVGLLVSDIVAAGGHLETSGIGTAFLGNVALAKSFGIQPVYRLYRREVSRATMIQSER